MPDFIYTIFPLDRLMYITEEEEESLFEFFVVSYYTNVRS